jgi:hypothetical protein
VSARRSRSPRRATWALALLGLCGCGGGDEQGSTSTSTSTVVEPKLSVIEREIFAKSCTFSSCHGEVSPRAGLDLTGATFGRLVGQPSTQLPGRPLVRPGDPEGSYLFEKLAAAQPRAGAPMPYLQPRLSAQRLQAVRSWIAQGARPD